MSTKEQILNKIKKNIIQRIDKPVIKIDNIQYPDKLLQFKEMTKGVGGDTYVLQEGENLADVIKKLYPEAKTIGSNLEGVGATFNPDEAKDAHDLNGTDLAVIKGEFGVAENACIWVPQNVVHKALYFISEYLVILLDKDKIVNTMHEAYQNLSFNEQGFGIFISGPSKTADIEQSLVIGAHGAKGVTVILK